MALATDRSVFLHIPKTAGMFVRAVFDACGIAYEELGHQHAHFPQILQGKPKEFFEKRFLFTFVRHPLTWYQSRWAFRVKKGWITAHPIDFYCASNDFRTFVRNVLAYEPTGWYSRECRTFIDSAPRKLDFIGHSENALEDCILALQLAGEKFDPATIRNMPRVNDSDMDGYPSKYWAVYNPALAKKVLAAEKDVITRYYSDFTLDIASMCGTQPY